MKSLLILAVFGLMITAVLTAHRNGPQVGHHRGGGGAEKQRWGQSGVSDRRERHRHSCACRNQCDGNTGTKYFGCFKSRGQYLQCVDTTCTIETCPDNHLFNFTTNACKACPSGYQVDGSKRRCVCAHGSQFDFKTRSCGPCPTGSIVTADRCFCAGPTSLNRAANACQACPAGTVKTRKGCVCSDKRLIWNSESFTCESCPGEWVNVSKPERRHRQRTVEVCQCLHENQVFSRRSVSCITCPINSLAAVTRKGKSFCQCSLPGQKYEHDTNKCVNRNSAPNDDDDDDDEDDDDMSFE